MPDLITHVAIGHLIKRPFELKKSNPAIVPLRTLFYLGTILPDILTRPWYILFPGTLEWTYPFHTPIGMVLTCSLLALLFESSLRKKAFYYLLGGAGLHFLLDGCQKHITYNEFWLYPFSWKGFGFRLFWAGDIIPYIPLFIGMVVVMEVCIYFYQHRKSDKQ